MESVLKYKFIGITLITFFIWNGTTISIANAKPTDNFLTISDIHFSPFGTCPLVRSQACTLIIKLQQAPANEWKAIFAAEPNQVLSTSHQETNYALLESTITELRIVAAKDHPHFALFLGDALAHGFRAKYIYYSHDTSSEGYYAFVAKTFAFLSEELKSALPDIDVYPAVGNNDSYTGNYRVVPQGRFLADTAKTWSSLIVDEKNKLSFLHNFPDAGYYAVNVVGHPDQRILVLNTVLFSPMHTNAKMKNAAQKELNWLHEELFHAYEKHQKVLLAFHIPVGIDVYKTARSLFKGIQAFWLPEYSEIFRKELQVYPNNIVAILPGHIHMDSFQVLVLNQLERIPVSFTPSISPIYGNNPGFKVFRYKTDSFELQDFDTYYFPLGQRLQAWQKEYDFDYVYQANCNNCDVTQGMEAVKPDNKLMQFYEKYYGVGNKVQPMLKSHQVITYYWCGIYALTSEEFKECVK